MQARKHFPSSSTSMYFVLRFDGGSSISSGRKGGALLVGMNGGVAAAR